MNSISASRSDANDGMVLDFGSMRCNEGCRRYIRKERLKCDDSRL